MRMNFFCSKQIPYTLCQPRPTKGNRGIGEKWWCFVCKRYIVPDKFHTLVIVHRAFEPIKEREFQV